MPFKSKSQMRAAFAGKLGPEMQGKARQWADETPNIKSLPNHAGQSTVITTDREKADSVRSSIRKLKGSTKKKRKGRF